MPRSATKSQAEQRKRRSSAHGTTPPAQEITGHSQTQWTNMLIQEDADEIVGEIMDELMSKVMEGCFKSWIQSQFIPFSVSWAKSYLTQTVEHHFMCLDEGEGLQELSRTEDSEPMPATLDSLAQGCVPVFKADHQSQHASQQEIDMSRVPIQTKPTVKQQCDQTQMTNSTRPTDEKANPRRPVREKLRRTPCPASGSSPPTQPDKKKQQVKLPLKHVQGNFLPPLSCSTEEKDIETENKNVVDSAVNQMTRSLHRSKEGKPIPKLDPCSLPKLCIFPQYEIVDDGCSKGFTQDLSGLPKLSSKYNKHQAKWKSTSLKQLNKSDGKSEIFHRRNERPVFLNKSFPSTITDEQLEFSGPLRLDTMVLTKGVSLLKHQEDRPDPHRFNRSLQPTNMKPMQSDAARPLIPVHEVISGLPPKVIPIPQSNNSNN